VFKEEGDDYINEGIHGERSTQELR